MVLFRHRDSRGAYGNPASPSPSVPRFILCLHPFPPHTLHHDRLIHRSLPSSSSFSSFLPRPPPGGCASSSSFPCSRSDTMIRNGPCRDVCSTRWIDAADFCSNFGAEDGIFLQRGFRLRDFFHSRRNFFHSLVAFGLKEKNGS